MNDHTIAQVAGEPALWHTLLELLGALALIIPLLYVVTRLYARRARAWGPRRALNVIDSAVLGPNRALCLVEVGNRLLVVAAAPDRVGLLTEITDPDEIAAIKEKVRVQDGSGLSSAWRSWLWGKAGPRGGDGAR